VQAVSAAQDPTAGIAFSTMAQNVDVYSLPMNTNTGVVTGDLTVLTQEQSVETFPSISLDGRQLAYISTRLGVANLWLRDIPAGTDTPLYATRSPAIEAYVSADGTRVVYTQRENSIYSLYIADVSTGASRKLCDQCGAPTHISPAGDWVLLEPADLIHSIVLLNTATGSQERILQHSSDPEVIPFAARFSTDGRWIAFHAATGPKPTRQIMVAPFAPTRTVTEGEWISITDGAEMDREAFWSPDGKLLYFLSDRDGFRCIWSQALDPQTKRPVGSPSPIYHFHHKSLSVAEVGGAPSSVGLSASRDALVFSVNRIAANVWFTR
jgi:eukaryotic-like serine/threonine-protein kinase